MIKFLTEGEDGKKIIGLGISEENVTRLKLGQPILVKLKDLGLGDEVVMIFYGKDEAEMTTTLMKELKVNAVEVKGDSGVVN